MLGLKLIHVSKRGNMCQKISLVDDFEQYRLMLYTFAKEFTGNDNVRYQQNVTQMPLISILTGWWITRDDIAEICYGNILHFVNLDHHLYILINPYNRTPEICTQFILSLVSITTPEKITKRRAFVYFNPMRSSDAIWWYWSG